MTIKEWKEEFAKLYLKMIEDIQVDDLEIKIKGAASLGEKTIVQTLVKIDNWE